MSTIFLFFYFSLSLMARDKQKYFPPAFGGGGGGGVRRGGESGVVSVEKPESNHYCFIRLEIFFVLDCDCEQASHVL